jgi:uncharacterized membrane protein YsdA (DUF1294 family)
MFLWVYLIFISLVTYHVYCVDKDAAETNGPSKITIERRVPERTLHFLALAGGWPGALFAQQTLRHKTIKQPFQTIFWFTVVINILLLLQTSNFQHLMK